MTGAVAPALLGPLVVVGQTVAIYAFLIVGLNRLGKRSMAQLTLVEYVIIALLGSAVETGLYSGSGSLVNGLTSAATLLALNRTLSMLVNRWPSLRRFLVGVPIVLVHNGQFVRSHLRQVHLTEQNVLQAIRQRGYDRLEDVRLAVLETNGTVGVVPRGGGDRRSVRSRSRRAEDPCRDCASGPSPGVPGGPVSP